jgi:alkanesulfonate monooxygenase SsuD/methylene tetrahydromethanopterin reductase-like flavin-dependent oxidoreductase (luciferase family)
VSAARVGCVYLPQFAPELLVDAARAADESGLDELWLWEDCFLTGGISTAAIALASTRRLTVGVGVLPVPMRNVAATAMEIATLSRAFPGRVRIGVGHGVQDWMEQIGARVPSPMTLLREYLTTLRALLDGQRVTVAGTYVRLTDVQLDWPAETGVEILCAATGPKTLRLSGELATGTVLTGGTTAQGLRDALVHIRQGRAGDSPHSVVTYLPTALGVDAKSLAVRELARLGLDPQSGAAVYGTPAEVADGARRWIDAGADTVVFQPAAEVDIIEFISAIGAEVQPLVGAG